MKVSKRAKVIAATLLAVLCLGALGAAQMCRGTSQKGCSKAGAVCSPVTKGAGASGRCQTNQAPAGEKECECVGAPALNLSGTWLGNDGGVYYLRQSGGELWWAGFSAESPGGLSDLHKGIRFTNVFHGEVSGNTVTGDWADVPRGQILNSGTLSLTVSQNQIQRTAASGGFGATSWSKTNPDPAPDDIFNTFDKVKKNQNAWHDHSLLDNLKPAKSKPVAIFGTIVHEGDDLDPMHVNYLTSFGRSYHDFICLNGNDSPPDADIDFGIAVDRANLDAQLGFWANDWETSHRITPSNFGAKLSRANKLHVESIMFGGTTECGDGGATSLLLPGWQQAGSAGVLVNGVPIAGQMDLIDRDLTSARITSILGRPIPFDVRVRVTGNLVLDCGHGWTRPCEEDDADEQNQEIHPVYALDFVQDWRLPRPGASLTGVWGADDAGTYYVRQLGDTVWWLGLSTDEGRSFANVFLGKLQNDQLSGNWSDVPLGATSNRGVLGVFAFAGPQSTTLKRTSVSGGFGGDAWEKLYDSGGQNLIVVFESAEVNAGSWPKTDEPFEFTVAGQKLEVQPKNPVLMQIRGAGQTMQSNFQAKAAVNSAQPGPLQLSAGYAGYRASWTIPEKDLKPGSYTQVLTSPRRLRAVETETRVTEASDRDARRAVPPQPAVTLPSITVHYRVEEAPNR
jgi:hypothetical protein